MHLSSGNRLLRHSRFLGCAFRYLGTSNGTGTCNTISVTFVDREKQRHTVQCPTNMTLMEAARDIAKVDIEAACDGTCSCSTCHVYLDEKTYEKISSPSEDEKDMLDLSESMKDTSRLSCQINLSEELDGLVATIAPEE